MECQRGDDCLILRKKNYGTRTTTGYIPVWEHGRQTAEEERAKEGKNEIDFGSTHPIVLRYQVTRSSLISDRQVGEREREREGRRRRQFPVASSEDERPPRERRNFSGSGAGKRY